MLIAAFSTQMPLLREICCWKFIFNCALGLAPIQALVQFSPTASRFDASVTVEYAQGK